MKKVSLNLYNSKIDLYNGDCIEVMETLSDKFVDHIISDPPYETTQNRWDSLVPFKSLWELVEKKIKRNGNFVVTTAEPFTSQFIFSNLIWFKYDLVWVKTIGSGQLSINKRPLKLHENILVFAEKIVTYNEQLSSGAPYKITRKAEGFSGCYGKQKNHEVINDGTRRATTVLNFSNPRVKDGHPTQKPLDLFEYLVKTYSNEGDTVMDYCMGSGTTGEACVKLKRNFIGIEKDVYWFEKSISRLQNTTVI
jgi:site-specific DNA-methyltransferase (adenine-specific)